MPDDIGTVLPNRKAVRDEAMRYPGEILKHIGGKLSGPEWSMTVRNGNDRPITGVLGFNAGTAKRIGIKLGDLVRHPIFGT